MPNINDIYDYYDSYLSRIYIKIKLLMCPFYKIESLVPKEGKIADLGCGIGLFSNILALTSGKRAIEGYDIAETRINTAKKSICKRENISFIVRDTREFSGPNYDAIVISDALYLIPLADQASIVKNCFNSLKKMVSYW